MEHRSEERGGVVVVVKENRGGATTGGMREITIDHTGGIVRDLGIKLRREDQDRGATNDGGTMNPHQGGPVIGAIRRILTGETATGIEEKSGEDEEMLPALTLNRTFSRKRNLLL